MAWNCGLAHVSGAAASPTCLNRGLAHSPEPGLAHVAAWPQPRGPARGLADVLNRGLTHVA